MTELPTIPQKIREHARSGNPARLRFGRGSATLSYAEFWDAVEAKLRLLHAAGFAPGQRVALTLSNTLDAAAMVIALLHAGGTIVPLYYREGMRPSGKQFARILSLLGVTRADLVFTHEPELAGLQAAIAELRLATRPYAYEHPVAGSAVSPPVAEAQDPERPAIIQFSAGSTAEPKGICLLERQLAINLRGIFERIDVTAQDRGVSWLPLYHDMGLFGGLLGPLYIGGSVTLYPPAEFIRDPMSWLAQISADRVTFAMAPQFAFNLCLMKHTFAPGDASYDLSSLRIVLNGAEVVDPERCEAFEVHFARFGLRRYVILPSYGLAENCVGVCLRPSGVPWLVRGFERSSLARGARAALATAADRPVVRVGNGSAISGTEISVLDEAGSALPAGTVGEVAVSGSSTARAILSADGTLQTIPATVRTGDLGVIFEGELFVVGRIKEMVKRGGESLAPTDVEQCVSAHVPGYPVAVFGYLDEERGSEELVVVIETAAADDPAHREGLAGRARAAVLREFHLPLADVVVAKHGSIPRTTSGKVRRVALREGYVAERLARRRQGAPVKAAE